MKATGKISTPDRLITNQVLYQLSHSGINFGNHARRIICLIQKKSSGPIIWCLCTPSPRSADLYFILRMISFSYNIFEYTLLNANAALKRNKQPNITKTEAASSIPAMKNLTDK